MSIQQSPPARQTTSQARTQALLTQTQRAPLDATQKAPQLGAELDRGPILEGRKSAKKIKGPAEYGEEEQYNSVEEEDSDGTGGVPAPVEASQGTEGPTLAQSNQPVSHQSEPSLLANMQQMTQIMANLPAAERFHSVLSIDFNNDLENFSQDRKKVLYAISFLIGRAAKWIEPYLSDLSNQESNYLLNSRNLFESQLFTLFGDPNEVRKAEAELDSLRMKEGVHVSSYIAYFRSLVSRIGDWDERAIIHHFRKGLPCRSLDKLASQPSRIDSIQDLMDITLELDTRYHERQNEKIHHQEKKPEASKSNSSHPKNSSSSSQKKKKNFQKRDKPHSSLLDKDFNLMNSEKERRIKEGLFTYCVWKHTLESSFKRPQNKLTEPLGKFPSQGKS
ncbi:hypothetical protein O181_098358 [Austropuccinia psidii MF-1]|uniref:Retrotransposon gag domain-containing protein n=1 Tax=Austropuccinia psidii MF-1 TaxID=1389203 RepID=A0A9Q3JAN7_9BASI|nr:hypothetical protein [Austropuccinia psidii MF-1]